MTPSFTDVLGDLLTDITSFVTWLITALSSFLTWVTSNPILVIFVLIIITKMVIGIVKRWLPGRV